MRYLILHNKFSRNCHTLDHYISYLLFSRKSTKFIESLSLFRTNESKLSFSFPILFCQERVVSYFNVARPNKTTLSSISSSVGKENGIMKTFKEFISCQKGFAHFLGCGSSATKAFCRV